MIHEITIEGWHKQVDKLEKLVRRASYLTAITGAGISIPSGLPPLEREVHGIPLEMFFQDHLWREQPNTYFKLYREILEKWRASKPNPAHFALVRMNAYVITQNIDGLHRDAGSERLIELHGNLRELRCDVCEGIFTNTVLMQCSTPTCPNCQCVLRPGITFEGDEVRHINRATEWVGRADVLFVIGTKLEMLPIRELPHIAHKRGCHVIWVNCMAETILPAFLPIS